MTGASGGISIAAKVAKAVKTKVIYCCLMCGGQKERRKELCGDHM